MNQKNLPPITAPEITSELLEFRSKIDAIDDKIMGLLQERIGIVGQVGAFKRRTAPGRCPLRPGREAEMVRRIMDRFKNNNGTTPFPPATAAAMWRILIGTSTSVESPLTVSAFVSERDNDLFWLAREYFGPSVEIVKQPYVKRVIGDVMDGKASVGIVPMLRSSDTTYWWTNLTQQNPDTPKIFAHIPFVSHGTPGKDFPCGLAIARVAPEDSGDDRSLLVIETDYNVSQNRLQTAFVTAKLEATWINIATLTPDARHHLIEIQGFVNESSEPMKALFAGLGSSLFNACFLGSYAVPIIANEGSNVA